MERQAIQDRWRAAMPLIWNQEVASGSEPTQMAIPLKMELRDF
jgi:hypothetical protein